jgi:hypothetical protein
MATLSRDTSEETERIMLDLLRKKSPAERIKLAAETSEGLRRLAELSVRSSHPGADEDERRRRFAARWLGREWAIRLFGWDPEQHGW